MSSSTEPNPLPPSTAMSVPRVIPLDAESSEFVEGSDHMIQLSAEIPEALRCNQIVDIVEFPSNDKADSSSRKAA